MHSTRIHGVIGLIISLFYRMGIWHRGDKPTVKEMRIKLFYCVYHSLLVLTLVVGTITNGDKDQSIFLAEVAIGNAVVCVKLWLFIWKQNEILDLLNRVCVFSIRNNDDHNRFDDRVRSLMKFVIVFVMNTTFAGFVTSTVLPFLGDEKTFFFEIAFPLDYRNSDIAFWMAFVFLFIGTVLTAVTLTFAAIIWYLLFMCSLRYEVLGSELRNMGSVGEGTGGKLTETQMHRNFFSDLKTSIDAHLHLKVYVGLR